MSPKLPVVTPKQLIRALKKAGFIIVGQTGSHVFMHHPEAPANKVPIPYHAKDIKKGTLSGILKLAGLSIEDLIKIL